MTVSKEISHLEHSGLKLTVTVGKDDVQSEYDKILTDYTKNIRISGFRQGKVPKDVLIRKYGESLKGEALGHIIEQAITGIFEDETFPKEHRPLPYSTPQIQDKPVLNPDEDLVFSVVYDVLPQITVGPWQGLEIEVPDVTVSAEDLNRELEEVRERNAIVLDRDEGVPAAKDDVVTVNYLELDEGSAPIAGTEREDFVFTLGSGYNIFQFDDEIMGMKKGETKDIVKTYPEDFSNKELAGKTKKIRVSLTALKEKKLPDLDDELAQDVDEKFKTLDDLKAGIKERLTKNIERRLREIKISRLLEKIIETTPVDVPESMIRIELDSRWRSLARQLNTPVDQIRAFMENSGKSSGALQEEWRPSAVKALHSRFIVETLLTDLHFEASDAEMEQELEDMAAETNSSLDEIKKYYEQENMKEYLKENIKERKLFDRMLSENTIILGKKENYLDLMKNYG